MALSARELEAVVYRRLEGLRISSAWLRDVDHPHRSSWGALHAAFGQAAYHISEHLDPLTRQRARESAQKTFENTPATRTRALLLVYRELSCVVEMIDLLRQAEHDSGHVERAGRDLMAAIDVLGLLPLELAD